MRRHLLAVVLVFAAVLGIGAAVPAQAAPPGPQCGAVIPCDGPIEKITRICQYAYCQFP